MARKKLVVVDPKKIKWEPAEEAPKGVWTKLLWSDKKTGATATLTKFDKSLRGCEPEHKHPQDRHGLVLEGKMVYEIGRSKKEIKRGMYAVLPAGVEHSVIYVRKGTVVFGYVGGPPP